MASGRELVTNPTPSLEEKVTDILKGAYSFGEVRKLDGCLIPLHDELLALIESEKQKAVEGILTKVEDWAHSNSDMGGDMPYGELLEYLTELKNTPSDTKGDIDEK